MLITVGKIASPHGLRGLVNVVCFSDFPERLTEPGERWLLHPDQTEPVVMKLLEGIPQPKGHYRVRFDLIDDRNAAEHWQGALVQVPAEQRPHLGTEEYYADDLIGLTVRYHDQVVGTVSAIASAGNDLLSVELTGGETVLVPFVQAIVPVVDLEAGFVEITPPKGLLPTELEGEA